MKITCLSIAMLFILCACAQQSKNTNNYPAQVGDIAFDKALDDPSFTICNETEIQQYYNFGKGVQYVGEKPKITQHFKDGFNSKTRTGESGYLTIRFIVNCHGKTGRYRVEGMNSNFEIKEFDKAIVNQLLSLSKKLDGWIIGQHENQRFDYYQYLTFKLENGILTEIMP